MGVPVGSRVLLLIPSQTGQTNASASPTTEPAVAVAVDIVAQSPPTPPTRCTVGGRGQDAVGNRLTTAAWSAAFWSA